MNERQQAKALAKYLDDLLGEVSPGNVSPGGVSPLDVSGLDPEISSLASVARSLVQIDLAPGARHRARFEQLLVQHQPALQTGGTAVPRTILGLSGKWFGVLFALLSGLATMIIGIIIVTVIGRGIGRDLFAPGIGTDTPTLATTPTLTRMATIVPAATITSSVTSTATETPTLAATPTITPTATVTPSVMPTATVTSTPMVAPTPTVPITEPARAGLAFHPAQLHAGGKASSVYQASGSLKNHGPDTALDVRLGWQVVAGAGWVERVEIAPAAWDEVATSKPGRFTVFVYVDVDALPEQKGAQIVVRLFVEGGPAEATFQIEVDALTEKPIATEEPTPSVKPEPSPKPTQAPRPTKEPKPTQAPKPTKELKPTQEPKPTRVPGQTRAPRPTQEPKPTREPRPTRKPEPGKDK